MYQSRVPRERMRGLVYIKTRFTSPTVLVGPNHADDACERLIMSSCTKVLHEDYKYDREEEQGREFN